ncbi:TPA: HAMP domain-containing histidine kinase [Candidatus Saccharibacteria bacterium]|nr:HAMP domain-containing histidine kinase [Candidatus Saccharibacteria bacterium]HIO88003.1 HAMP domain-containing histidine kinase [Candidatus Saccharibacteria bacterium]
MFHSATIKLTAIYLAILIGISIGFSLVVFNISSTQFDRRINAPEQIAGRFNRIDSLELQEILTEQANSAKSTLRRQLVVVNIGIIVAGGAASYYLARRTLRPIEQAHEAQGRFVSDASHELRTPLAIMQSEIEVALREKKLTAAQAKELLTSNLEEVATLRDLSEALLQLTRADKMTENQELLSTQVIRKAVERVAIQATAKQITIKQLRDTDFIFKGDSFSAEEALVILLDNAVKYSVSGSEVAVDASEHKHSLEISVIDNGIGIKAVDQQHIFDTFYRADQSRSDQHVEGFGLGLSLAKRLMNQQNGKIKVNSEVNKGSTFTLVFLR